MTSRVPAFRITLEDEDITPKVRPRLISLTLTEARDNHADQLDLVLDDADGQLALPPRGAKVTLHIGWKDGPLVNKGSFTVDEVEHSGAPDTITLRARTADLLDNLRSPQERSFHKTTLGAVITLLAFENNLHPGIAKELAGREVEHIDQTHESDAAFLRRLGKHYDAVATIKNDTLIFAPASLSKSVSGKDLPAFHLSRKSGDSHRFSSAERDSYSGVRAYWYDPKVARKRSIIAGIGGNTKGLRTVYTNRPDARVAAIAEWQRILRGVNSFEISLALGEPALMPQAPVRVAGFKPEIDATDWVAVQVTHTLSDQGFTTQLQAETKTELADDDIQEEVDPDEGITGVVVKWKSNAKRAKVKSGQERAGEEGNVKTLEKVYAGKVSAKRAAEREWKRIQEVREVIRESLDSPSNF